ncbi:cystathionine gamma-synthase [Pasteurellaceae bacterium RH1A]|nr:cystathionine gamma-synthase [Pasteurellaceae bacterium RH1A]
MKKIFALLSLVAPLAFASIEVQTFDNPKQEADYRSLVAELRCPQCQNNNIADSNATIATDMRNKTLELLKQGKSKDEVVDYMVERYGNFVTYDPPMTPATIFLWALPLLLILLGGILVFRRKQAGQKAEKPANALDQTRLQQILDKDKP